MYCRIGISYNKERMILLKFAKLLSTALVGSMLISGGIPAYADDSITLLKEAMYTQDFENADKIESVYFDNERFTIEELEDGSKALLIDGSSKANISTGYIGPVMNGNVAVSADIKQLGCTASGSGYFGIRLMHSTNTGKHQSYNFGYSDTIRLIEGKPYVVGGSADKQYRDSVFVARGYQTHDLTKLYIANHQEPTGALDQGKRFFDDFYGMRAVVSDDLLVNSFYNKDGTVLKSASATPDEVNRNTEDNSSVDAPPAGQLTLVSHSTKILVDNVKIMEVVKASEASAALEKNEAFLGEKVKLDIKAIAGGEEVRLDPSVMSYDYDKSKLSVDFEKGTVMPIAFGEHTFTVSFVDVLTNKAKSVTLNLKCNEGYDMNIAVPTLEVGEATGYKVSKITENETKEITSGYSVAVSEGLTVDTVSRKITATNEGLNSVTLTVNGTSFTYPVAVNDSKNNISIDAGAKTVYTFDDGVLPYTTFSSITPSVVVDGDKNVLSVEGKGKQGTSDLFGSSLGDYTVNAEFKHIYGSAADATFGIGLRAGAKGHYQVSYSPMVKINTQTGQVDTTAGTAVRDRLLITKATANSGMTGNMVRNHTLLAYSPEAIGIANSATAFSKYYRLSASVCGTVITASIYDIESGEVLDSISADVTSDATYLASGQTLINSANTNVNIDSLEIVPNEYVNKLKLTADKDTVAVGEGVKLSAVISGASQKAIALSDLGFVYDASGVDFDLASGVVSAKWEGSKYFTAVYADKKYATVRISQLPKKIVKYECTDIKFFDEFGEEINYMPAAGDVGANVTLNNRTDKQVTMKLVAAVYSNSDAIVGVAVEDIVIEANENTSKIVTVPLAWDNDRAYMEVFAFNNFDNMLPMFDVERLEAMPVRTDR